MFLPMRDYQLPELCTQEGLTPFTFDFILTKCFYFSNYRIDMEFPSKKGDMI